MLVLRALVGFDFLLQMQYTLYIVLIMLPLKFFKQNFQTQDDQNMYMKLRCLKK